LAKQARTINEDKKARHSQVTIIPANQSIEGQTKKRTGDCTGDRVREATRAKSGAEPRRRKVMDMYQKLVMWREMGLGQRGYSNMQQRERKRQVKKQSNLPSLGSGGSGRSVAGGVILRNKI
jgi:hypothetical protein